MISAHNMKSDLQMATLAVTTSTSAAWDLSGCDYAILDVVVGTRTHSTTAACTLSVLTSDDTVVSNHATVVANQSQTPGTAGKLVRYLMDTRANTSSTVGNGKRYLRLTTTPGTVATADAVAICAILHKFRNAVDVSGSSSLTASTNDTVVQVG